MDECLQVTPARKRQKTMPAITPIAMPTISPVVRALLLEFGGEGAGEGGDATDMLYTCNTSESIMLR
jgi:hypothetical protein